MKSINDPLKKIANSTAKVNLQTTSSTKNDPAGKEPCPICGGSGFVRKELPVHHPDFGKAFPCICKQNEQNQTARERLYRMSNLESFSHMTFSSFSVQGRLGLGLPVPALRLQA